jgi:hypothetical protein
MKYGLEESYRILKMHFHFYMSANAWLADKGLQRGEAYA